MVMERWCISCHKATGPLTDQPAPQLSALAADAERSARTIRAFLMHPHPPMPALELSNKMIEDIIAYLRQVKAQQG
jgi:mono/diheme cytochrome c family protein